MSRSCVDRPPTFHGSPEHPADCRVFTEFGADAWTWPVRAGFAVCEQHVWDYPSAMTLVARMRAKQPFVAAGTDGPPLAAVEPIAASAGQRSGVLRDLADTRAQLASVQDSWSWKVTRPLRWTCEIHRALCRRIR